LKQLKDIIHGVAIKDLRGPEDRFISSLELDSRKIRKGQLFVAQKGWKLDGHRFIDLAITAGAVAVLCENLPDSLHEEVTYLQVEEVSTALACMAANYFDRPSEKLTLVGITGTNGKTTIATLLYRLFSQAGFQAGLLSTVQVMVGKEQYPATHTTPDAIAINRYLNDMVTAGVSHCFMEVSSHGIAQQRTRGLAFNGGVFTNLTHDHLDYHQSFKAYRDVKKSFFDFLPATAFALVNVDDKNGSFMVQNTKATTHTYALKTMADMKARILENRFSGLLLNINGQELWSTLTGRFNAYNLLAVYGVSTLLGFSSEELLPQLSTLESVSGRFQCAVSDGGITAIVDYAHTPDALKNVLETINDIRSGHEQLITVVGCGGDRDTTKRPVMGRIAAQLSTQVIFTSDNPRTEDPIQIIDDIVSGVDPQQIGKTLSITDREQALKTATKLAVKGDIILIAGKGHETYQEVNGERHYFNDYQKINELLTFTEKS